MSSQGQGFGLVETNTNIVYLSSIWTSNIEIANDNTLPNDTLGSYANYKFKNGLLLPIDSTSNSQNLLNYGGQYVLDDNRDCLNLQTSNYVLVPNNNWTEYSNLTISGWFKGVGLQNGDEILNFGGDKFIYDASNLVAWYRFDNNNITFDSSGKGNTLINYSATFDSNNKVLGNGSVYFNGSSQYMEFSTSINPYNICISGGGGISVSFWFKTSTSSGSFARIFDMSDVTNPSNHFIVAARIGTQTNMRFSIKVSGTEIAYNTTSNWVDNIWHHGVWCISESGRWSIYIDNVALPVNISRTLPNITWGVRYIARSTYSGDGWFVGNIDDFRIYNRILSPDDINRLYSNGGYYNDKTLFFNDTTNMLAWYRFNTDSTRMLNDSSGRGNTLTNNGSVAFDSINRKFGDGCISLSTTSQFLNNSSINLSNVTFSISVWVRPTGMTSSTNYAICGQGNSSTTRNTLVILIRNTGNFSLAFWNDDLDSAAYNFTDINNIWTHLVFIYNKENNRQRLIYRNGILIASNNAVGDNSFASGTFRIGALANGSTGFIGNIDDFRIYNRVLSADEIASLYYTSPYYNTIYKFYNQTNDMICWYKFDSDSTNMLLDSSGNNRSLTNVNCLFNSADFKTFNGSVQFTGSSYFEISNNGTFSPDNFTISCWCKIVQPAANTYVAIASCRNVTTNEFGWIIYIFNNRLEFWTGPGTGGLGTWNGFNQILYNNFATSPATWEHLAITMNKSTSTAIVYINGISVGSFTRNYSNNTGTNLRIGAGANNSTTVDHYLPNGSLLDDFRMYNRVLTAGEINQLYSTTNTLYNPTYSLAIRERNEYLSFQINDIPVYETSNILNNTWNHFVWNIVDSSTNLGYVRINNGPKNFYNQLVLSQPVLSVYPPAPMTGYNTMIDGITYRICSYDFFNDQNWSYTTWQPWRAFTKINNSDGYHTWKNYSQNSGTLFCSGLSFGNDTFKGYYLGIDMGQRIVMKSYKIMKHSNDTFRLPRTWKIYATNDERCWNNTGGKDRYPCFNLSPDFGWVEIDYRFNQSSYVDDTLFNLSGNNSGYRFYAININSTRGGSSASDICLIGEWYIYGYPYNTYINRLGSSTNKGTLLLNDFRIHTNTVTNTQFDDNAYDKYYLLNNNGITSNQNMLMSLSREEIIIDNINYSLSSNLSISTWIKTENFANNDTILEISNSFLNDTTNLYFWYKFDQSQFLKNFGLAGGAYDLIGSVGNNVVCQTTDSITGTASANFTSTSGYLYSPQYNFATYFVNAITISFWLRRKGLNSQWDNVFYGMNADFTDNNAFIIERHTNYTYWAIYLFGNIGNTSGLLTDYTADNVWNHYVLIAEKSGTATKLSVYKNSTFIYTNTSGTWTPPNVFFRFSAPSYPMTGNIDDFRIYNRALTLSEIQLLAYSPYYKYYNDPRNMIDYYSNSSNLVALYKFDNNATDMLLDSSGNGYNLTNNGATFDSNIVRRGNGSIAFSTINTFAILPVNLNPYTIWNGNGITFSIWFRGSNTSGANSRLFDFADNVNGSTIPTNCIAAIFKNGSYNLYLFVKINGINYEYVESINYLDNNWHHLVWSISSSGVWTVYIDNVNKNAIIQVAGISTNTISAIGIPNVSWNRRYIGRSVLDWDNAYVGNMDDFRIYNKVLTSTEVDALYNLTYNQNPFMWYRFDKDASSMLLDSSGNGYNLTNFGVTYDSNNFKIGIGSISSTGTSQYVNVPSFNVYSLWNNSSTGISFSFWTRVNTASVADYQTVLDWYNSATANMLFYFHNLSGWKLRFQFQNENQYLTDTTSSIVDNNWHHVVLVCDKAGKHTLYVDNVINQNSVQRIGVPSGLTAISGNRKLGSFSGNLDDFRLYNRILSAAEVNILYNLQTTNSIVLKRSNNLLSFQINETPIYETPYIDNKWNHILWNIANTNSSQGFIRINNGSKIFFDKIPVNFNRGQNIVKFPPVGLATTNQNDNTKISIVSGQPYGNGTYLIDWSSDDGTWRPSQWFNGINSGAAGGHYAMNTYSQSTGLYVYFPPRFLVPDYYGEWVRITLPNFIYLTSIKIYQRSGYEARAPLAYRIYGSSNNGITWNLLLDTISASYTSLQHTGICTNTSVAYNTFAMVVNKIFTNNHVDQNVNFDELEFYGTYDTTLTKLSSISNSGDIHLYNYNMISTALTTQIENDLYNTIIPSDYSEYVAYNNIRIYPDRIRVKNKDYITSNYYLDYDFKTSRLSTDNTSNIRSLNLISGGTYLKDYNKNTLLLKTGQEAQFPNENWMNYNDLTISGWFKSDRSQLGDDIILEMTGNSTNIGILPKNNFFNDITNLYFWYKFDSIDFCKNYGLTGKDYDLQPSSGSTIYPQKTDKVYGDASANFTASSGFLYVPTYNFATNFTSAFTISFWLRRKALNSAWDVIFYGYLNGAANTNIIIERNNTTTNWAIYLFGANTNTSGLLTDWIADNIWNHYVWIAEKSGTSTKLSCYKNGVFIYTTITGTWTPPNMGFILSYSTSSVTLIGNLDDFRIYNKALSQDEINILYYNSGFYTQTANLVAWYQFNGDGTQMLMDSSGNNNMLINNNGVIFDRQNSITGNGSAFFDSTSTATLEWFDIPTNINPYTLMINGGITIAFWVRMSFTSTTNARIFEFSSTGFEMQFYIMRVSPNYTLQFNVSNNVYTTPNSYIDEIWHHLVWSISSTGVWTIYIDGVNLNVNRTHLLNSTSISRRYIGRGATNTGDWFNGNIDDFRIYNRVITATEAYALYSVNPNIPNNYIVRRRDNTLSFQINNIPIYETPYTNDTWSHFIWSISQGYIKINNGSRNYFNKQSITPTIFRYPPAPLTAASTILSGYGINSGTYVSSASSSYSASEIHYNAFNRDNGTGANANIWTTNSTAVYNASGTYIGSISSIVSGVTYSGEWLQIQMPVQTVLKYYYIYGHWSDAAARWPKNFVLAGSNNGSSWTLIDYQTNTATFLNSSKLFTLPNNTQQFTYYRLIVLNNGGSTVVSIQEWELYGYPIYLYMNKLGSANNQGSLYLSDFTILTNRLTQAMETQLYTQAPEFKNLSSGEYLKNEIRNISALYWNGSKKIEGNWNGANVLGTMTATGNITSFFSDMRLKDVVCNIEYPIEKVKKIDTFKYIPNDLAKSLKIFPNKIEVGVSAQSVKEVLPEIVELAPFDTCNLDNNIIVSKSGENYLSVSYENMVPLLIESIKDLNRKFNSIKSQNPYP